MNYQTLRYDVADRILTLTLHRPERMNAFTGLMADELIAAFDRADADDDVKVVIVTGAGRAFCAGALKNVLVGDVWVCSGQSNMEWTINQCGRTDLQAVKDSSVDPNLRLFMVPKVPQETPVDDISAASMENSSGLGAAVLGRRLFLRAGAASQLEDTDRHDSLGVCP